MSSDAIETEAKLSADNKTNKPVISRTNSGKGASRKFHSMATWLDGWEQEDTYAALAVACAAVSVTIAYN
ncbi:sucrase-like protein, partial [Trifolium medium]|nr:sucrase-like protein [Trifolium medium]